MSDIPQQPAKQALSVSKPFFPYHESPMFAGIFDLVYGSDRQ
jgi:hypothetical protein